MRTDREVSAFVNERWCGVYLSRVAGEDHPAGGGRLWETRLHSPAGPVVWTRENAAGELADVTARGFAG